MNVLSWQVSRMKVVVDVLLAFVNMVRYGKG